MKEAIKHNAHLLFSVAVVELPIFKVQLAYGCVTESHFSCNFVAVFFT